MTTAAPDISWSGPDGAFNLRESGHTFRWVPARELGDLDFRPFGLVATLPDHGDTLRHVVLNRLDRAMS